jgi:hypothetical protein
MENSQRKDIVETKDEQIFELSVDFGVDFLLG